MGRLISVRTLIVSIVGIVLATAASAATITVSWDGSGDYLTIQEGITAAVNGDTVLVLDGTYAGPGNTNLVFGGRAIAVRSQNGPDNCTIDGGGTARGFSFGSSDSDAAIVDGFTITNGDPSGVGGAIACQFSSPTIMNCVITNNDGSSYGGAIFCYDSDLIIINCTMANNEAARGGAIALQYSSPEIINCTITGNTATASGGGLYSEVSAPDLTNCILWGDIATTGLEIFLDDAGPSTLTVSYSDAQGGQAAVYNEGGGSTVTWGLGNIDADPLFVDAANDDFHLSDTSPCIDAGDSTAVPPSVTTDLDGEPRIHCAAVDMGAYESQSGTGEIEITCPTPVSVECLGDVPDPDISAVSATGACGTDPTVTYEGDADNGGAGCLGDPLIITRTYRATGASEDFAECTQTITVVDTTAPVLTVPAGITVECDASTDPANTGSATATDNCDTAPTVTHSDSVAAGTCPDESVITRTWTATDACGNSVSAAQVITVVDATAPVLTVPGDVTIECDASTDPANTGLATATDNCDMAPAVTYSDSVAPGACEHESIITRTWTATDACNNSTSADQVITVEDTVAPVLTIETTPIVVTDVDCSGDEAVALPAATATDNCDASVVITDDAPAVFPAGETTTVTFTATDDCGNAAIEEQVDVTVKHGATIRVIAKKFTIGFGTRPWITREPLVGIPVAAFEKSPGTCAWEQLDDNWWVLWWALPDIFANCPPVTTAVTDENGLAYLDVPPGDYVVASYFDSDGDGELDMYLGRFTCGLECGEMETERLFMLHLAGGRRMCGRWHRLTGSELIVVEPDEVLWDGEVQPYPFAFDSDGVWDVTVSVEPPEGFVSDYDELSEDVDNELEAVQFNITEVGSDLVPTQTRFEILHRGERHIIESEIGIRLTPDYARQRGFDVEQLRARGLIKEKPKARARQPQPKP